MKNKVMPAIILFAAVADQAKKEKEKDAETKGVSKEDIAEIVQKGLKEFEGTAQDAIDALKEEFEAKGFTTKEEVEKAMEDFQKQLDEALTKARKAKLTDAVKPKFFDAINEDVLPELKKLKNKQNESGSLVIKAPGDLDETIFQGDSYSTQVTQSMGLYMGPQNVTWLRNLLPNSSTTSEVIHYLRVASRSGGAAIWDGSGPIEDLASKPTVDFTFDDVTENVEWIAGIARIKRQMLDDIPWMRAFLQRELLVGPVGLLPAENAAILSTLTTNATAYDGSQTDPIKVVYDAAFGQLPDSRFRASYILMNPRDVVNTIFLNDQFAQRPNGLPAGTVGTINGQLTIAGVPVIGVPEIAQGSFLVFDRNATLFVNRMNPELRFFEEDRDNVIKNLITVRAEERMATLVFDANAIVGGAFPEVPEV